MKLNYFSCHFYYSRKKNIFFPCFYFQMENPWNIQSIYDFQFFNCPSCIFKNHSKQEFFSHAYQFHPESIEYFQNINDESLNDIVFPSELDMKQIKTENYEVNNFNDEHDLSYVMSQNEEDNLNSIKVENVEIENESQFENSETFVYEHFSEDANFDEVNINEELTEDEIFSSSELVTNEIYDYASVSWAKTEQNKMKKHKCEICKKAFITPSKLKRHTSAVHNSLRNNYNKCNKCDLCGKVFSRLQHLKTHISCVHEGQKMYKCDWCDKAFGQSEHLKTHVRIVHEGIKNYQCTYCSYAGGTAQNLRSHISRIHEKH